MTPDQVAAAMAELLELDEVALDDNFFEIGGNSFTALELATLLEQRHGIRPAFADVVRTATPQALADLLQAGPTA
ncbi:hypothetical protein CFP65_5860 [Kitasatospora sp. MMS16-BH015]|uniref:phosphopantetheine-binding protein n=1 Tax=Kitasatospora sp. MMS16-BH015 TaxID=2018025 RepID=UPI000CA1317E|nr:phosphopantetheine-binding protein [Kitasatospora sp. MMS16-BH015]AUG80541.1 hypothetical protein CFP65_5860 [Kitasatospora sp. MMS16-BH015]